MGLSKTSLNKHTRYLFIVNMSLPVVTVTVFRYLPHARLRAFSTMGRFLMNPVREDGLRFGKLMGSGHNFGLIPDLSTYVFLGVWEMDTLAQNFSATNTFQQLQKGTEQTSTLYLTPLKSHGFWDGQNPFRSLPNHSQSEAQFTPSPNKPVAVLTRATIRPRALLDFWRHVPQARQRLTDSHDDLLFGIGIGEVPLVQQCTVSVWRNEMAVDQYAYRQSGHKEVVKLTRHRHWYSEELFARFSVLRADGTLFADVQHVMSSI